MANTKGNETASRSVPGGAGELDDTMLCDNQSCGCEEADVERGTQRFCSEACADMSAASDEAADVESDEEMDVSGEEQCACGHAECEAAMTAGAGEESGTGRDVPRSPSGRE